MLSVDRAPFGRSEVKRPVGEATVSVNDLSIDLEYRPRHWRPIVRNMSINIEPGRVCGLIGESGSGKTVTGLAIAGLLNRSPWRLSGAICIDGKNVVDLGERERYRHMGHKVAMVFQEPMSSLNPVIRIGEQIAEGIRWHLRTPRKVAMDRAIELLDEVGIPEPRRRAQEYPHVMSGGMCQRVMLAIALACEPRVLIADEPTTALDVTTQAAVLELLKRIVKDRGLGVLMITHDLGVVAATCDSVTVMRSGEMVEQSDTRTFFDRPSKQYSQQLLAAARASFLARAGETGQAGDQVPTVLRTTSLTVSVRRAGLLTSYHDAMTKIVSDLSMSVLKGEVVGLIGESGSGKSTIARAITGLQQISSGELVLGGSEVTKMKERAARILRRDAVQMVFQDPYSSLDPLMTVEEIVTEALPASERGRQSTREHAGRLLSLVGLDPGVMTRYPSEFSGGQRQRIAIARALAPNPQVLICDEATSALDMSTRQEIVELLGRLREEMGLAVLFISHDLATIRGIANKTYIMYCGELVECGPSKLVMASPKHPYTKALIASILEPAIAEQATTIGSRIVGEIPSIHQPPRGCRFHPRCPHAVEVCGVEKPVETIAQDGSMVRCHLYQQV